MQDFPYILINEQTAPLPYFTELDACCEGITGLEGRMSGNGIGSQ
jgi:hypothetical protein